MKCTVLMGSPNRNGNTAALLTPFLEELTAHGCEWELVWLYDRHVEPCLGCKVCQDVLDGWGCVREDEAEQLYNAVLSSDLVVLATPIYAWYCTAPMKAFLDRLIYAGCKYYGAKRAGSTLTGIPIASVVTCGYPAEKGADVWETGLKRFCKHCGAPYLGMFSHRDMGRKETFMTEQAEQGVRDFARSLICAVQAEQ